MFQRLMFLTIASAFLFSTQVFAQTQTPIKPNRTQEQLDTDLRTVYSDYKSRFLRTTSSGNRFIDARGTGPDGARCTTQSEAHGYGMMVFALATWDSESKAIFDGMNQLRKAHPSTGDARLMSWVVFPQHANNTQPSQTPAGPHNGTPGRRASATDGDLDMAYALLLAHTRWGDQLYLDDARRIIAGIKESNMHLQTHRTNLGDWSAGRDGLCTRPSDWMPGHFRAFYKATDDNFWLRAADTVYALLGQLSAHNSGTGLVPDFAVGRPIAPDPRGCGADENNQFINYSFNACRVPWRLATDWIHHEIPAAKAQIDRISTWLRGATGSNPENIRDGYQLNGTAIGGNWRAGMPFIAPFAAGMTADPANQQFLNATWNVMRNDRTGSYGAAIQLLCMFLISGNWQAPFQVNDGKFEVHVIGGNGSGRFEPGDVVEITAVIPTGREFRNWTSPNGITFANANSATTTFIMPERAVSVTANFGVIDYDLARDLAYWSNWQAQGNRGTWSVTPDPINGIVQFSLQTQASSPPSYAWADVLCEFNIGDFNDVSSIEITYTSSGALNFILIDNRGFSNEGLGFTRVLPRATTPSSLTINLSEFSRRNDWGSDARTQFRDSDRASIRGVLFNILESASANGQITKLLINGLNVGNSTAIVGNPVAKRQLGAVSVTNRTINFNIPNENSVRLKIHDVRGRLLFSENVKLNSGAASLNIPTPIARNQTLILNIEGKNGFKTSQKILLK